ncbi:MAG: hypothetical protein KDB22_13310 [Planctomycetales bacterium]|nr:hypothetical protein [Planctomycetales bacterium]
MTDNPYESTRMSGSQFINGSSDGQMELQIVKDKVAPPAIALMVVGGLSILASLYGTGSSIYNMLDQSAMQDTMTQMKDQFGEESAVVQYLSIMIRLSQGPWMLVMNLVAMAVSIGVLVGAIRMSQVRSYTWSLAAAVLAMLPIGNCCCIGLPIGIWALVVLQDATVKQVFQRTAE